jgi:predicted dehydrogenase
MRDFLEAIEERRPPLVTAGDALQTLQVAEAGVESQRRGRRVDILTQGLP